MRLLNLPLRPFASGAPLPYPLRILLLLLRARFLQRHLDHRVHLKVDRLALAVAVAQRLARRVITMRTARRRKAVRASGQR